MLDPYVDAVRSSGKASVVRDLLHAGLCPRCAIRFVNAKGGVYGSRAPGPRELYDAAGALIPPDAPAGKGPPPEEPPLCPACLGILQHCDGGGGGEESGPLAGPSICSAFGKEGHVIEGSVGLEVTIPPSLVVRQYSVWYHLCGAHPEAGFSNSDIPAEKVVDIKDALKHALLPAVEEALGVGVSPDAEMRVSLAYSHPACAEECGFLDIPQPKTERKRKRGGGWAGKGGWSGKDRGRGGALLGGDADGGGGKEGASGPSISAVVRAVAVLSHERFVEKCPCPPLPASSPCALSVRPFRQNTFVGGRYLKFNRAISQSPWMLATQGEGGEEGEERKGDSSVEEEIANRLSPHLGADQIKFVSAGREDIDVRMLGAGRPFILEVYNARMPMPGRDALDAVMRSLAESEAGVECTALQGVGKELYCRMKEGEAEKVKAYECVVWLSRAASPADLEKLHALSDLVVQQKTPVRVYHRRTTMTRPKVIHELRAEHVPGNPRYLVLRLRTQAGTYIKEFVHGDMGRTTPSLGSLLGCEAEILQLDVARVEMDFL